MNEKELDDKLTSVSKIEAELPEHRRRLKRALMTFSQMSSAESARGEKTSLSPRQLRWQPIAAGLTAIVVIVVLAVSLPLFGGRSKQVSASEIALSSPEVQAVLGGFTPGEPSVTNNIDTTGYSRVVVMGPWDKVIVAYVDVLNKKLVSVVVANIISQDSADATDKQALDILNANPHMQPIYQGLLDEGLQLYFMRFTVAYPDTISDPQNISGLPVVLFMKDQNWAKYYFIVDIKSGSVSGGGSPDVAPLPDGIHFEVYSGVLLPNDSDINAIFGQIHAAANP
jgi:hypothetical protein